jgi:hypothetical protein
MDSAVLMRWDFVAAADVPQGEPERERWLFDRWAAMDAWIEANRVDGAG